ncbi:MAG TPA: hypothetical protein VJ484_11925, partial [Lysobacter sp.]|nr:hypothetical protein [Lysobacter sp.]
ASVIARARCKERRINAAEGLGYMHETGGPMADRNCNATNLGRVAAKSRHSAQMVDARGVKQPIAATLKRHGHRHITTLPACSATGNKEHENGNEIRTCWLPQHYSFRRSR